jgi:hypothetical protein
MRRAEVASSAQHDEAADIPPTCQLESVGKAPANPTREHIVAAPTNCYLHQFAASARYPKWKGRGFLRTVAELAYALSPRHESGRRAQKAIRKLYE